MRANHKAITKDLARLVAVGKTMLMDMTIQHFEAQGDDKALEKLPKNASDTRNSLQENYQRWFTEAEAVIRQLIPQRRAEFVRLYQPPPNRKKLDFNTYVLSDWLQGMRAGQTIRGTSAFDDSGLAHSQLRTQLEILKSASARFESSLLDIRQLVQADLFDSELDAAQELHRRGFLRAAGAVAGVVLERHLKQVTENHELSVRKKRPTIADFNDQLKEADVLDIPTWRHIQRLADLRNLCDHDKEREPTSEEVQELISGVDRYTKSLF